MNEILQRFPDQRAAYLRAVEEGISRADTAIDSEQAAERLRRRREKNASEKDSLRVPVEPHSCSHCQRFVINNSMPEEKRDDGFIQPKYIRFDVSFAQVKEGAKNQCSLCQSIVEQLDRFDSSFENDRDEDLICWTNAHKGPGGEYDLRSMNPIYVGSAEKGWTKWANRSYQENWHYDCVATEGDPASSFITTRPIVLNPASDDSFALIRSWLAECTHGHDLCQHLKTEFRPLRLIEISGYDKHPTLRLYEVTDGPDVDYTTLSYCWGGPQPSQTISANFEQRKKEILFESLPATIQDAISVTHRLRIGYIFVDSLCIIQDSPEDKSRQIATMPQIYQNSTLTISVPRAVYAGEGFLQLRKPTDHPHHVFSLPYLLPSSGELGCITLLRGPSDSESLNERGWTLQEAALSPRILEYSASQTRWICNTQHYVDGWQQYGGLHQEGQIRDRIMQMRLDRLSGTEATSFTFGKACAFWENLVGKYTSRLLTVPSDRPLAMAGLAEACCGSIGRQEQYMAGLWRSMFPWALFWSMPIRKRGRLPRPSSYQGPSWSWTSVNGAVHFGICRKLNDGNINLKVLECSTELQDDRAPFGAVTSGALVVKGRKLRARWCRTEASEEMMDRDVLELEGSDEDMRKSVDVRFSPDAREVEWDEEGRERFDVVLLEIGYEPPEHRNHHGAIGFALKELEDGFYTRLGIFETSRARQADGRVEGMSAGDEEVLWNRYRDIYAGSEREVLVIVGKRKI